MSDAFDLLLVNGTVLNPAAGPRQELDVGIAGGRITAMQAGLPRDGAKRVLDVQDCFVTPGLIDFHVHSYGGVNPYGFDADPICCATGVTTAADAGSAGPVNFPGFRRLVYERSRTRMLSFVAVAQHGVLNVPGELENIGFADPEGAARTVRENPDIAVGIKIRLHVTSVGENGREALGMAVRAGDACDAPVMVHVGNTGISMEEIVETMRPGDVMTHCYTPKQPAIVDPSGRLRPAVLEARERGVIFDVAHANGHFDFDLVSRAMDQGVASRHHQHRSPQPQRRRPRGGPAHHPDQVPDAGTGPRRDRRRLHRQRRPGHRLGRPARRPGGGPGGRRGRARGGG